MAIQIDAAAMESRFGNKTGTAAQPAPIQDLSGINTKQMPLGTPVPEGVIIQQQVGRGRSMTVVPPKAPDVNAPAMAVVPPQVTNRTSLGTYVEVTPTISNPLTSTPVAINSGIVDEPVEKLNLQPRKKLDLTQLILDHIFELGGEKSEACQKFYDRGQQTIANWCKNPAIIPLGAINKFLTRAPEVREDILEVLEPHFAHDGQGGTQSLPNRGKMSVIVCGAVLDRPTLPFMWTMLYLAKKYELGFDVQADTMIDRSRNMLAHRFLKTGAQWSLWIDSDIAAPIANPDWYRWVTRSTTVPDEVCSLDVLERLLSHRKAIVGGVYSSRWYHGQLVIQPELKPRSHEDKLLANQIRNGLAHGLSDVDWIGFGCALVHREVFLELQRRFPNLAPKNELEPWGFFDKEVGEGMLGEDEAFCKRAKSCAIPVSLDTQLVCGHIGNMCFMPEHTTALMAL